MEQAMFDFATQALRELVDEWRRQGAIRRLSALSDHLLDDIGLRRDQLPTFMQTPTIREPARSRAPAHGPELLTCG
jgi:uncharacterized protein YjiS (DUF1127 family)